MGINDFDPDPLEELARLIGGADPFSSYESPPTELERRQRVETQGVLMGIFGPDWQGVVLECYLTPPHRKPLRAGGAFYFPELV